MLPSVPLYSIDTGTASGPFVLNTTGLSVGTDIVYDGAWVGTTPFMNVTTTTLAGAPSGTAFAYGYGFTLGANFFANDPSGKPALVSLQLDGNPNGAPPTQNFYLKDLSSNQIISSTVAIAGTTDLALSALIPKGNTDSYSLLLLIPQSLASKGSNNFTISGSVPVPGSLVMFGVFLLGLIGLSYGNKAKRGW